MLIGLQKIKIVICVGEINEICLLFYVKNAFA